ALGVAARPLARGAHLALPAAEAKCTLELGGQHLDLGVRALDATGVGEALRFVALARELGEPGAISRARLGIARGSGVAAVARAADEIERVELAPRLGEQAREHLHAARILDVHTLAETGDEPELARTRELDARVERRRSALRDDRGPGEALFAM